MSTPELSANADAGCNRKVYRQSAVKPLPLGMGI
jgi:hypothetical protein